MIVALLFMVAMATSEMATANGSGTYVIISPSKLRPNADFTVSVNILEATQDVNVKATISELYTSIVVASENGVFQAGQPGTLSIKIPKSLTPTRYLLEVEGSGGLTFTNSTDLSYIRKELSLFIQTDKGIYKAGDTVNFRVFGIYSDMKLYLDPIDIEIYDKDYNLIKQWVQVKPKDGVITQMLKLSSQPPLGDWTISASASEANTEKDFTVDEYVLPKFEVSVELPSYVLTTETDFTATVKAKYTYGKPVKGTADIAVGFIKSWSYVRDIDSAQPVTTFIQVPMDGEAKITVPIANVKSMNQDVLIVSAKVTESLTGNVMSGKATVTMYDRGVKLEFPESNPKTFKPGLEYTALLKVSQPDGLPVNPGAEQITVSTRVTIELPQDDTITTRSNYPQTQSINLADVLISVPDNGLVAIPVTVQPDAKNVEITAKLSGASTTLNLGKSHSPSSSYIQLALKTTSRIKAGDNIDLEVSSTQPLTQLVYQVLSRGRIVKTGLITSQKQTVQPFVLATDVSMAPHARIVAYYVTGDGEIVTDSISFNVDGAFLNKVSVKLDTTDAGPGDTVAVTVNADPSSAAYLAAIDQSVLLLKSGNDVTADDVMAELEEYDTISNRGRRSMWWGWPVFYGGSDATQIFKNSGVSVLTDCLVYRDRK
ncbi:Cd109 antigen-like [Plakobranchus ocellatus]|uniref:Cd109 antigen-like n=1 Tax=Plakobranchus ocellatus TaxID=259542 RepID=A0AAV4AW89_9GAST|nr:Cd109 antigen-like [Plakobranchus ocellatus]